MQVKYSGLLESRKMGPWELSNSLIMAPMGSLNATKDGYVTDRTLAFYDDMSKGGSAWLLLNALIWMKS